MVLTSFLLLISPVTTQSPREERKSKIKEEKEGTEKDIKEKEKKGKEKEKEKELDLVSKARPKYSSLASYCRHCCYYAHFVLRVVVGGVDLCIVVVSLHTPV